MAVVIRLQRTGKRKQAYYRVVAIEKTRGPQGRPIEVLGSYNPRGEKPKDKVQLDRERFEHWLKVGAKASDTVESLAKLATKAEAKPAAEAKK
ncbi:MAG: 30S ribosomal protein S16 [Elusimicrobia bacterium]|nr:30S ribosomal protein S16 [Elusimicrobiota bacterium]